MGKSKQFKKGDLVQVTSGVKDTEYPDLTIGGWVGKISQLDGNLCEVNWSEETISKIDPIYKKRCSRDGFDINKLWLEVDLLEIFQGGPIKVEPQSIKIEHLSPDNVEDRIRAIFKLTSNDPIPDVKTDNHEIYRVYLEENLLFPFRASITVEMTGKQFKKQAKITRISETDSFYGILCESDNGIVPLVNIREMNDRRTQQIIKDYSFWFHNYG